MHPIQEHLLALSKRKNLAEMSLRDMASAIGMDGESPQKMKHHLLQLEKKGFLQINKTKKEMNRFSSEPSWAKGFLDKASKLLRIPIVGTANCGPATIYAEQNVHGFLRMSSKLSGVKSPDGIYAIKADGVSMNRAEIGGKKIDDGDYVIVDSRAREVNNRDIVVAIVDGKATIKRYLDDKENGQIVLMADSSFDYDPIYLDPSDDFTISGKVIGVMKRPSK